MKLRGEKRSLVGASFPSDSGSCIYATHPRPFTHPTPPIMRVAMRAVLHCMLLAGALTCISGLCVRCGHVKHTAHEQQRRALPSPLPSSLPSYPVLPTDALALFLAQLSGHVDFPADPGFAQATVQWYACVCRGQCSVSSNSVTVGTNTFVRFARSILPWTSIYTTCTFVIDGEN